MVDIYLQEIMHGRAALNEKSKEKPREKSKFDKLKSKYIDELIASMPVDESPQTNQFESSFAKKEKLRLEMLAEANDLEFNEQVQLAIETIDTELVDLTDEQFDDIQADFAEARKALDEMDVSNGITGEVKDMLGIHKGSIDAIFSLAIKKYQKQEFEKSMCLFMLLSKLDSADPEYSYRAGISAQVCGQTALALKLYGESLKANATSIGPKLFSIECQLALGFKEVALKLYNDFKEEVTTLEEKWVPILQDIEHTLSHAH